MTTSLILSTESDYVKTDCIPHFARNSQYFLYDEEENEDSQSERKGVNVDECFYLDQKETNGNGRVVLHWEERKHFQRKDGVFKVNYSLE